MRITLPVLRCITLRIAARGIAPGTGIVAIFLLTILSAHADMPRRIVSLNLCADELLLRLVPSERIQSVTWLARDPAASNVAALAAAVPVNHGSAEEVIPSAPDLVLVGEFTTIAASSLLRRTGFPVVSLVIPNSFEAVSAQIARIGRTVGAEAAADRLAAEIEAGVAAATAPAALRRPRALVLNPNGVTVGAGTLTDAVMQHAGLDNVAAQLSLGGFHQVPLELLASLDIEVLVLSSNANGTPSLATDVLRHPVLSKLRSRMIVVELPGRLWSCSGPELVDAVTRLRAAADAARVRGAER